jgi:hypothetical protein
VVRMAGVPASIRLDYLPDTSLERHRYSNQLGERLPKILWIKVHLGDLGVDGWAIKTCMF